MIEKTSSELKKEEKLRIKSRRRPQNVSSDRESFGVSFGTAIDFHLHNDIDDLLEDLKHQEKRFIDTQTVYELNRYKAVVQKILTLAVNEGMKTRTLKRLRKDRSDFTVVEKINEKLMEMQQAVTRNNRAFDLLKTIEEIRGLILDLRF